MTHTLYYVYDPMCSWCYAFAPTFKKVKENLPPNIKIVYVPGGLAPHTNEPMPLNMREKIQSIWYQIEEQLGTKFNHDFWTNCTPKRATYLACQATIAAKTQGKEEEMIEAIQEAYYLKAMNPSEEMALIQVAEELELDISKFKKELNSKETIKDFTEKMNLRRELHLNSFPSLAIKYKKEIYYISIKYNDPNSISKQIEEIISEIDL